MYETSKARSLWVGLLLGLALMVALPQVAGAAEKTRGHGVLARGAGYAAPHGSPAVKRLQRALRAAGRSPGKVDGLYGPRTARAVRRVQTAGGMKADGVAGPRTRGLLTRLVKARREAPAAPAEGTEPAPAKRPASVPAVASPVAADDGSGIPWMALLVAAAGLGLVATLLARMGVPLPGRRGPEPAVVPLGKGLALAGESNDPEIGRFSGVAYAVEIPDVRDPARRAHSSRFYVLDPKRRLPFWVQYSEVQTPLPPALQAHPDPWGGTGALQPGASVLGYVTVPTSCPERHAELFAQIELIEAHCKRRGFRLVGVVRDEDPADQGTFERPGIAYALEQFAADSASALVVSDVTRLGRSRSEIDELLGRLSGRGVSLVALDPGLDTSTAEGSEAVRTIAAAGPEPAARRAEPFARRMRRRGGKATAGTGANGARRQEVETVGATER
jgi:peptidoglycan hydrolase-like protein with peptidoglycan-binding domain